MSRHLPRGKSVLVPLILAIVAACQDTTAPRVTPSPKVHFAQGDNGTWTVNLLTDANDGVCDDAHCTLREAIAAASSGGKIVFLAGLQGDVDLMAGELSIIGKSVTIDGAGRIRVDGQSTSRVFRIFAGATSPAIVKLAGLSISRGVASPGAGIQVTGAQVTLDSVTVSNNSSDLNGGGIAVESGIGPTANVTIRNSVISDNGADMFGGGVFVDVASSVTLVNTTVRGNRADDSGAGIYNRGALIVTASTISGNEAGGFGGGIGNGLGASATVVRSTISGNKSTAGAGGGIDNIGTFVLRNTTVTKNTGGGIYNGGSMAAASSIIAGNVETGTTAENCAGPNGISMQGYNLAGTDCGTVGLQSGEVRVSPAQVFTEVLEAELKDNGGPTWTHALITRGRAVDAGYCPGETADQRGFARPVDDPIMPNAVDGCDIGAYELQGPVAAVADLMVSQTVDRTSVKQGEQLTYTVRVRNLGPQTAPNVVVANVLSSGVTFVEARSDKGTLTAPPKGETGTVTWSLGNLLDQANEFAEIRVTVLVKGKTTITNKATVTGDVADPNAANNSASITVSVAAGSGGKGPSR